MVVVHSGMPRTPRTLPAYISLHDRLRGPITKALQSELGVRNALALPRLEKVIVNVGINRSTLEGKEMQEYIGDCLTRITGQKPVFLSAKKAISNFKIRKGSIVGAMVTLRGGRMEAFLDRLLSIVLPRMRDFRGLGNRCDGQGNYALGIREHSIFPEIPPTDVGKIFGLQVQLKIRSKDDQQSLALLRQMGFPFRKDPSAVQKGGGGG